MRTDQRKINKAIFYNNYVEIILENKKGEIVGYCKVDKDDYELLKMRYWCLCETYAATRINATFRRLHSILFESSKTLLIDHKNRDSLDNRKRNLRLVDCSANVVNTKKRGYQWIPRLNKWYVQFRIPQSNKRISKAFIIEQEAINYRKYLLNKYRPGAYIESG